MGKKDRGRPKMPLSVHLYRIAAAICLMAGLALLAYPWISNALMEREAASSAQAYAEEVEEAEDTEIAAAFFAAQEYNLNIQQTQTMLTDPFDASTLDDGGDSVDAEYWGLLNLNGNGVMAYIEIPAISVYLPVYHGTSDTTLKAGIGHLEGSSLSVGGESTHAVLTGHTGLSAAKLFTDLDKLEEGDMFYIHVLGETLAYEVHDIQVVEPEETGPLLIQQGKDLVTLVTCTPYGVNSHRLFVTGERVDYQETTYTAQAKKAAVNTANSQWMREYAKALLAGLGIALTAAVAALVARTALRRQKKKKGDVPDGTGMADGEKGR